MSTVEKEHVETKEGTTTNGPDEWQYDGWFCIKLNAPPMCGQCGNNIEYAERDIDHRILVWEEKDEDTILNAAISMRKWKFDPKIVEYEVRFGKCIPYDRAEAKGHTKWVTH
jgi:hypothetical protein